MSNTWFYLSAVIAGVIVGMGLGWWALLRAAAAAAAEPIAPAHDVRAVGVQYTNGGQLFGPVRTIVLGRCEGCNLNTTKLLDGRWSLGEVSGNPDDDVVDATIVDVEYPYTDGDHTILGPECFTNRHGDVISYQGDNFYRAGFEPGDQHGS